MNAWASYESADGRDVNNGYTVLEIVKHATNAVMNMLQTGDRLCLVVFNTQAEVVFPLVDMNRGSRARSKGKIFDLKPNGRTNIWEGLFTGLE